MMYVININNFDGKVIYFLFHEFLTSTTSVTAH